jgi:hypothetical protein
MVNRECLTQLRRGEGHSPIYEPTGNLSPAGSQHPLRFVRYPLASVRVGKLIVTSEHEPHVTANSGRFVYTAMLSFNGWIRQRGKLQVSAPFTHPLLRSFQHLALHGEE